ncbi:hypothetical protein GCM10020331_075230 [Ectobacillus funiculus]
MNEAEFKDWPISFEDLLEYYNKAEEVLKVTQEFTEDSLLTDIIIDRLHKSGFPQAMHVPIATDVSQAKFGKSSFGCFFSSISFLAKSLNIHPFDLSVHSRAVQVIVENNRVTGVKVLTWGGKTYIIRAKKMSFYQLVHLKLLEFY